MISLEARLRENRDEGHKLLVPYVTGGMNEHWLESVRTIQMAGANAIEIGIPFSDPVMDGPVIQAASVEALKRGTTPQSIINELRGADIQIPVAVMTYFNLVYRFGFERFAKELAGAGVSGVILPDMPMEESGPWLEVSQPEGIETVFLVAPNTPDDRLAQIVAKARGFVYGIGMLGVTGERDALAESAARVGVRIKAATEKPALIGVGISTPEQAKEASRAADGVIIGSALVRRMLDGANPDEAAQFVNEVRARLDF